MSSEEYQKLVVLIKDPKDEMRMSRNKPQMANVASLARI